MVNNWTWMSMEQLLRERADYKVQQTYLRDTVWGIEREIEERLQRDGAVKWEGGRYKVTLSPNREVKWDLDTTTAARACAEREGRLIAFDEAFRLEWHGNQIKAKQIMKFGGDTARLLEAAQTVTEGPAKVKVEEVGSGGKAG